MRNTTSVDIAIIRQSDLIRAEREAWSRLQAIADSGDVAGFWSAYADYLESRNAISGQRQLLVRMARAVGGIEVKD